MVRSFQLMAVLVGFQPEHQYPNLTAVSYILFGIAWTHEYVIEKLVKQKKCMLLLPNEMKKSKSVYAFYEFQMSQEPRIKAFMDFFRKPP